MLINISCEDAAKVMNVGGMYIRMGLRKGKLPFGSAVKINPNGNRYTYHISANKFAEYLGITMEQLENALPTESISHKKKSWQ